ncbi:uncharacterized protein [Ptychodera flava]|uniref:uncharacterized protein n=1 Tax=Ptychodera flava TaxID=63121 RepID=UPI003969ED65
MRSVIILVGLLVILSITADEAESGDATTESGFTGPITFRAEQTISGNIVRCTSFSMHTIRGNTIHECRNIRVDTGTHEMKFPNGVTCRERWIDRVPSIHNTHIGVHTDTKDFCREVLQLPQQESSCHSFWVEAWYKCTTTREERIQWLKGDWQAGIYYDSGFLKHLRCVIPVSTL